MKEPDGTRHFLVVEMGILISGAVADEELEAAVDRPSAALRYMFHAMHVALEDLYLSGGEMCLL